MEIKVLDDLTIQNDDDLWRRIPPWHFVSDENLGRRRPSGAAFEDGRDGSSMSVVIARVAAENERSADDVLEGHDDFALAAVTAGLARECRQIIVRNPLPQEPAHGLVVGNKTKSVKSG